MNVARDNSASSAVKLSLGSILNPSADIQNGIKPDDQIKYPTRAAFTRYLEQLVAPKSTGNKALLEKRPAPSYMLEDWPKNNVFTMIKSDSIKELRRQANERKATDLIRSTQSEKVAHKIPTKYRQIFTANNKLKELIYEENLIEIHAHGRLFGPPNLTLQPIKKHNILLLEKEVSVKNESQATKDVSGEIEEKVSSGSWWNKRVDSFAVDFSPKESLYSEESQTVRDYLEDSLSRGKSEYETSLSRKERFQETRRECFDRINAFIDEKRKTCMMNLSIRIKEGEIARLKKMLDDEASFLAKEEADLMALHDEHDKYLKTICLRTAEAIKMADEETRKRVSLTEKIKRIQYKLAHMNAEYIKMEEEFIELSNYKVFLDNVVKDIALNKVTERKTDARLSHTPDEDQNEMEDEGSPDLSIDRLFKSPQDFIDILSELESDNLTLIENIQEQEEACERLRLKAAALQEALDAERSTMDEHIAHEMDVISELQKEISDLETSRDQIRDFALLKRYEAFSLGSINQFDPPWLKELGKRKALDDDIVKPTVGQLMSILQVQIHKIYCKLFGTDESANLDTLSMLKGLELEIENLTRGLSKYSRMQILKAKKAADEHTRLLARQRQKDLEALAHDAKLKRAIEKSKEPPRWQRGRRIIYRSAPPRERLKVGREEELEVTVAADDDADLFR